MLSRDLVLVFFSYGLKNPIFDRPSLPRQSLKRIFESPLYGEYRLLEEHILLPSKS